MINKYWLLITIAIFFSLCFSVLAGYQVLGESRDYLNYIDFFSYINESKSIDFSYRFEPGFTILTYLLSRFLNDEALIYCGVVGLVVFFKIFAVIREEKYWVALFFFGFYYLTRYFVLFEMTVLRAACSFSIAFFVFMSRRNENVNVFDVIMLVLACSFHYSAFVFLPIYFSKNLNRHYIVIASLMLFSFLWVGKDIVLSILPNYLAVFGSYDVFTEATFLPVPYLIDLLYLGVIFLFWKYNDVAMKYCCLGVSFSAAIHFALLDYSMLAARFRELISVFILIYVIKAMVSQSKELKCLTVMYVFFTSFLYVYLVFIYDPLLS